MPKKKILGGLKEKLTAMPKKRKLLLILLLILVVAALVVCIGWARISASASATYHIGKDKVTALIIPDGGRLVEQVQVDGEDGASSTYTYGELPDAGAAVGNYVAQLTAEGEGFSIVDEYGVQAEPPDFQEDTGEVTLTAPSKEEGKMCQIDVSWSQDQCVIALTQPKSQEAMEDAELPESLTMRGSVEYLQGFSPAALGLEGNSMYSYNIYPKPGTVYVDGVACMELDVCVNNPEPTSAIVASFFLAGDNSLYKLNRTTGEAEKLEGLESLADAAE